MLSFTYYALAVLGECSQEIFPHGKQSQRTTGADRLPDDWRRIRGARYFRKWRLDGTWLRIHRYLRDWVRLDLVRRTSPSVAIIDSQSVKIGVLSNNSVGYDGGKNIKGRKRHILVNTMGLVLMVVVTAE